MRKKKISLAKDSMAQIAPTKAAITNSSTTSISINSTKNIKDLNKKKINYLASQ